MSKYDHKNYTALDATYTRALEAAWMDARQNFAFQTDVTVSTPSAGEFTAAASDVCTKTAHGMVTGLVVRVSSTTTLPGGLSAATDYYVINLTADTFKLASSLVNAQAGTAIDITDAGTGTHTITPTALAGASIKFQESVDGQNWYDISGSSTNITTTTKFLTSGTSKCGQVRPYLTMTSGQLSVTMKANIK